MDYITIPDLDDIEAWDQAHCQAERRRLRNELSFLLGDEARGGPRREDVRQALVAAIRALSARLEVVQ